MVKFVRAFATVVVGGVLLLPGADTAQADGASEACFPVRAQIRTQVSEGSCDSPVGLCTTGTLRSPFGFFSGSTRFEASGLGGEPVGEQSIVTPPAEPATTWTYSGVLTVETRLGQIRFSDVGVLDTVDGSFTEIDRPLSGTGTFDGVTGRVFISGELSEDGTGFSGKVRGTLCVPTD